MEDKFTQYSKLYVVVFLLALAVPVGIGLLITFFYGFSKLISSKPVDIAFELLTISLPAAIFLLVFFIFFVRTKNHPLKFTRIFSKTFFCMAIGSNLIIGAITFFDYFKEGHHNITDYKTFNLAFLAGNIGLLFFIALLQALTTNKEEDWLAKRKKFPAKNSRE